MYLQEMRVPLQEIWSERKVDFMARTTTAIKLNSKFAYGGTTGYLKTSEDYKNVYATWETPRDTYVYAKMTLQRRVDGKWKSIETKGAYAENSFEKHYNANVRFTNIAKKGKPMRVKLSLHDGWDPSSPAMQTAYGKSWTR